MKLTSAGVTKSVQYVGNSMSESPGGIVYNEVTEKVDVFGSSSSTKYGSKGSDDWFYLALDEFGRN
jgi:hypothetical protein